jgi:predicted small secreted protein
MTRNFITICLLGSSLVLAACNTVKGTGKDLQSASDAVKGEMK